MSKRTGAVLIALLIAGGAKAAPIAPGYTVSYVDVASGAAIGDVIAVGGSIFVGVGPQGEAGQATLVRIDAGGTASQTETVIAAGFTIPGGMDYDPTNQRIAVVDNGLGASTPTGDNVYVVGGVFANPVDPPDAVDLQVLADGDIPGAADVLFDPNDPNHLFLTDASESFPPAGRLLEASISDGTSNVLQTGLGFAAGLASDGTTLFIGDVNGLTFEGLVHEIAVATPGGALDVLAAPLSGQFDLELLPDGTLISSSGGSILRIDPSDGSVTEIASGFGFTGGLWQKGGVIYALDGFAAGAGEPDNRIWILTPIPEPGSAALFATGLVLVAVRLRRT